jgi:YgiT-type zinc finger domain-containing protein
LWLIGFILMNCLICRQAEPIDGLTSVTFARGKMKFVVNNVPARICPSCGEAYVEEDVAGQLVQDAEEISKTGMMEDVIEYGSSHFKNITLPSRTGPPVRDGTNGER